jgi:[ribosomal protein S5]-alanine N-acetyltransferase
MTAGAEPGSELAGLVSYRKTTHAENTAERRSLEKAGFTVEGVIRAAEFRAGQWCDGYLYSRLRIDPDPLEG